MTVASVCILDIASGWTHWLYVLILSSLFSGRFIDRGFIGTAELWWAQHHLCRRWNLGRHRDCRYSHPHAPHTHHTPSQVTSRLTSMTSWYKRHWDKVWTWGSTPDRLSQSCGKWSSSPLKIVSMPCVYSHPVLIVLFWWSNFSNFCCSGSL